MKAWESITNIVGVFLLVVFLVVLAGYPQFAKDNPDGFTTASGNTVKTTDSLTAVGLILAVLVAGFVVKGKGGALALVVLGVVLLAFATGVNPH